jgi:hypothetical protein
MAVLTLLPGRSRTAEAGPLNPDDFPSLGAFPTASGPFTYDTHLLTITGPGIMTPLQGTLSASGVAVFDFDSINLTANQNFNIPIFSSQIFPVAFLSRGDITINGTLDARPPQPQIYAPGGPGGYPEGGGPGGGGGGGIDTQTFNAVSGGGGGGFGGTGGNGNLVLSQSLQPPYTIITGGGGLGGKIYSNLATTLQGGSGGGSWSYRNSTNHGGGGGGAIELGAKGAITVGGSILANGGQAQLGAGGGAGGGIYLHGDSVTLLSTALLSAAGGGGGGFVGSAPAFGGGGGGGEVYIDSGLGGFTDNGGYINVSGGISYSVYGSYGIIAIDVPEPPSLMMGTTAGVIGLGLAIASWMRRTSCD